MSIKVKLISSIVMAVLVICLLIVGVLAADNATITLQGSLSFEIDNRSLYLRDVRLQQSMDDTPETVPGFEKGFIDGEYLLDMSNQQIEQNNLGTFFMYFDIVNYIDDGVNTLYKAEAAWTNAAISGVQFKIREGSQYIDQATALADDVSDSVPLSGTLILEVNTNGSRTFDMSNITIAIDEYFVELESGLNFTTNENDKTATLTSYTGSAADLTIPASFSKRTVDGVTTLVEGKMYTVTAIAAGGDYDNAFSEATNLQHVTFPDTLKTIGGYAFYNRTSLVGELDLPSSLESIGNYAFGGCTGLTGTLTLPASLKTTGTGSFQNCTGLNSLSFQAGSQLETIGYALFNGCSGLKGSLVLPSSVKSILGYAFFNCTGMTGTLTLPSAVSTINQSAFHNTRFTGTLTIPATVTTMGKSVFRDSTGFRRVVFEEGFKLIPESTFQNCTGVVEVVIPSSVTQIDGSAFFNCTSLGTVYVDSPTIAGLLTARNSCGNLLYNALTVYVSTSASSSLPSAFFNIFTETTSTISGYKKYT